MSKKKIRSKEHIIVFASALFLALLFIGPMLVKGKLVFGDDLTYQLSRIIELTAWLKNGMQDFPGISVESFYQIGYGVNIFYPWMTLLLFSSVGLFTENLVVSVYIGFYLYTFITLLISYYCMKQFSNSWLAAAAFSILYTFSIYRTIDAYTRFALAEFIALTFIPLVLLGSYEVLFGKTRYWILVTIGFSLIVCTHVLSAFLICIYLVLFWGISLYFLENRVKRSLVLLFSGLVSIFTSAVFLFGFIEEQLFQTFLQPSPYQLEGNDTFQLISKSISSDLLQSSMGGIYNVGFTCILLLFLGAFFFKKLELKAKVIYILGIVTLFLTTDGFPWSILQNTPFSLIQFPFRLMIFPTLFFCITGANLLQLFFEQYDVKRKSGILVVTFLFSFLPWLLSVNSMLNTAFVLEMNITDDYFGQSFNRYSLWIDQYTPEEGQHYIDEIHKHIGYRDNEGFFMEPKSTNGALLFEIPIEKSESVVDLPVIKYKNTQAFVDGEVIPVTLSERGTMQLNLKKGINVIEIRYVSSIVVKIGIVVSFLSWVLVILYSVLVFHQKSPIKRDFLDIFNKVKKDDKN